MTIIYWELGKFQTWYWLFWLQRLYSFHSSVLHVLLRVSFIPPSFSLYSPLTISSIPRIYTGMTPKSISPTRTLLWNSRPHSLLSHSLHQKITQVLQIQPTQNWTHPLSPESVASGFPFSPMASPFSQTTFKLKPINHLNSCLFFNTHIQLSINQPIS